MKINYNPKYQKKHLSIRVPWHDNFWNGRICNSAKNNDACLVLKNCAVNRNDEKEEELAGKKLSEISEEHFPPCLTERGMFMSSFDITKHLKHPYAKGYNEYYKHFLATPVKFPKYSAPSIAFRWGMPSNVEEFAYQYDLDFDPNREPYERYGREPKLGFTRNWIQDHRNQKSLFSCFFEHVNPGESLAMFYAKEVPFIEDNNRVLIGIGDISNILQEPPFNTSQETDFVAMPWEHMVQHSIRPSNEAGFLFPYHEALEYQKTHPEFNPRDIAVVVPNEFRHEFSYATEHVSHDFALYILRESVKKIEKAKELEIGSNWDSILNWLSKKIMATKELRGDYPGFGVALTTFGFERGHFLAQSIVNEIGNSACPWDYLDQVLTKKATIDQGIFDSIHPENIELWHSFKRSQKERLQLLQLLSRFNLSQDQANYIFNPSERRKKYQLATDNELIDNPYLLFEISINSIDPISYAVIDGGLMQIDSKNLLPETTPNFHKVSKQRVRALTVMQLEKEASNGHTLFPEESLVSKIADLPIEPPCNLTADYFKLATSIFDKKITIQYTADGKIAYQLDRFNEIAEFINKTINKRLEGRRHNLDEDWLSFLGDITFEDTSEDKIAKEEKIKALEEMANARFSVLIGQAGSGKTTLLSALASIPKIKQGNVLFLAPTGKAKVRMEEKAKQYGVTAKTIASFLYKSGRFYGPTQKYQLNDAAPESGYKTVIIDECSMLTEEMLGATLQHLSGVQRLILVGDYRQLPPIGAGRPFFDIINYIRPENIDMIFPRIEKSYIELTASGRHRDDDNMGRLDQDFANLFGGGSIAEDADLIFEKVIAGDSKNIKIYNWENEGDFEDLLTEVLEKELSINDTASFNNSIGATGGTWFNRNESVNKVEDWQLLSPIRSKVFGTTQLNRSIHKRFKNETVEWAKKGNKTPGPFGSEEIVYGDKVINLTNHSRDKYTYPNDGINYLANGEIGITTGKCDWKNKKFAKSPFQLQVEFSSQKGYSYQFTNKDFDDEKGTALELAYALTIHKAQGSQFNTVLLILPEPCLLLSRELIYTALTRQVEKVIVLYQGNAQMLFNYTNDYHSASLQRITNLFYKPNIAKLEERFFERNLIHCASDGKLMRSKSEVIIYETLLKYDLKPQYEHKLTIDGITKRPDFYISDDDSGIEFYWEHLGMLSDVDYAEKWKDKLAWYRSHDILPLEENGGENGTLIITRDDAKGGISVKEIVAIIEEAFQLENRAKVVSEIENLTTVVLLLRNDLNSKFESLSDQFLKVKEISRNQDEKLEQIYTLLDKQTTNENLEDFNKIVKNKIIEYEYLEDNSRAFLASAFFIHKKLSELNTDDYSPYILQSARALENEILSKLFIPYFSLIDKLENRDTFLEHEFSNKASNVFARFLYKNNKKITLGMMTTIISFIYNENGNNLKSSPLLQHFRCYAMEVTNTSFLSKMIVRNLETITSEFRNKAAHLEKVDFKDVEMFEVKLIEVLNVLLDSIDQNA